MESPVFIQTVIPQSRAVRRDGSLEGFWGFERHVRLQLRASAAVRVLCSRPKCLGWIGFRVKGSRLRVMQTHSCPSLEFVQRSPVLTRCIALSSTARKTDHCRSAGIGKSASVEHSMLPMQHTLGLELSP